jgi:hypothetical protein
VWRQANPKSKFHSWEDDGDFVSSSNEMEQTIIQFGLCAVPRKGREGKGREGKGKLYIYEADLDGRKEQVEAGFFHCVGMHRSKHSGEMLRT